MLLIQEYPRLICHIVSQHHKSAAEAEAILNRENEKYRKELNDQLQLQLDQVLSNKDREAADIERQVLENEHKAAASEAARVRIHGIRVFSHSVMHTLRCRRIQIEKLHYVAWPK